MPENVLDPKILNNSFIRDPFDILHLMSNVFFSAPR